MSQKMMTLNYFQAPVTESNPSGTLKIACCSHHESKKIKKEEGKEMWPVF